MHTKQVKKSLRKNRNRLYEAAALLRLADFAEDTENVAQAFVAVDVAQRMVRKAAEQIDSLELSIKDEAQS